MKYCNHCGKELTDAAEYCTGCGCRVASPPKNQGTPNDKPIKGKGLGFVLSFFLGLLGFLLAVFLGDEECKQTATKTFIICSIISVAVVIIYVCAVVSCASCYY